MVCAQIEREREHTKNKRGKPKRESTQRKIEREREHTQRTRGANQKERGHKEQEGQTSELSKCRAEPMRRYGVRTKRESTTNTNGHTKELINKQMRKVDREDESTNDILIISIN